LPVGLASSKVLLYHYQVIVERGGARIGVFALSYRGRELAKAAWLVPARDEEGQAASGGAVFRALAVLTLIT